MVDEEGRVEQGDYAKRQKAKSEADALALLRRGVRMDEVVRRTGVSRDWLSLKTSKRRV